LHNRILDMSDEIITVRLRRDHATFLEANLALMAERTRAAMKCAVLPEERRSGLYQRAILLEHLDDAVRVALLSETPRDRYRSGALPPDGPSHASSRRGHSRHFRPNEEVGAIAATIASGVTDSPGPLPAMCAADVSVGA
jgi:hypothetical protein